MESIEDIVRILNNNGVILYPTDTIWGLGCRADNHEAIQRIFTIKKRDLSKPLSVLVSSVSMLHDTVADIHPRIETLLLYHEKPLTLIYNQAKSILPPVADESGSIGVRLTKDPFCVDLIEALGVPLVSTSANYSGKPFPVNFDGIDKNLLKEVDLVVTHRQGETKEAEPSVIARFDKEGELDFLRT